MRKAQKIVGIVFIVTLSVALLYMLWGIYVLIRDAVFTSFPWWSACYFAAVYFGPVLAVELVIYLVLRTLNRRRGNAV